MKIQTFKRLVKEDFDKQYQDLVDKIGYSVNSFADDVTNALNNNISIEDNLNQVKKSITVSTDGNGALSGAVKFQTGLKSSCYGIQVVNISGGNVSGAPFVTFTESNKLITVSNITGLSPSVKYTLSLILYS